MELQGKIIAALPQRTGDSKRNPGEKWVSQEFVLETHDTYPRKMCFDVFGSDRLQRFNIEVGQEVNVSFDIDAREWNGRWFNSIRAFDVRQVVPGQDPNAGVQPPFEPAPFPQAAPQANVVSQSVQAPQAQTAPQSQADPFSGAEGESKDDLPF